MARKTSSRLPDISLLMLSSMSLPETLRYSSNTDGKKTPIESDEPKTHYLCPSLSVCGANTSQQMIPVPHAQHREELDLVGAPSSLAGFVDFLQTHRNLRRKCAILEATAAISSQTVTCLGVQDGLGLVHMFAFISAGLPCQGHTHNTNTNVRFLQCGSEPFLLPPRQTLARPIHLNFGLTLHFSFLYKRFSKS